MCCYLYHDDDLLLFNVWYCSTHSNHGTGFQWRLGLRKGEMRLFILVTRAITAGEGGTMNPQVLSHLSLRYSQIVATTAFIFTMQYVDV